MKRAMKWAAIGVWGLVAAFLAGGGCYQVTARAEGPAVRLNRYTGLVCYVPPASPPRCNRAPEYQ